jgi:hypothetical protein
LGVLGFVDRRCHFERVDVDNAGRFRTEAFGNDFITERSYYPDKHRFKSIVTEIPARGAGGEAWRQFLDDLMTATIDGLTAARTVLAGGPPDIDVLNEYATALEVLRIGVAQKRVCYGWIVPTEDDVRNARHLVQLVREGAPSDALIEPARRAARVMTDPEELETFHSALLCLENEASRVQHLPRIVEVLDRTVAFFERGCNVAGFVPTPVDIANVQRLREIAAADGAEALAERLRLV